MFNRMKERAKITDRDPTFKARYIGNMETFLGSGRGCTTTIVQRLWDNSEEEHFLPKVKIKLTLSGLHMKFTDKKKSPEKLYSIENITFCNVDTPVNDRIFSWIYREADDKQFECHAVVCSSTEKAKTMALVLSRAFQIAYKEWKSKQTKLLRDKPGRTQRSVSMYTVTESGKHEKVTRQQSDGIVRSMYTNVGTSNGALTKSNQKQENESDKEGIRPHRQVKQQQNDGKVQSMSTNIGTSNDAVTESNKQETESNKQVEVIIGEAKLAADEKIVNGTVMKEEDTKIERF